MSSANKKIKYQPKPLFDTLEHTYISNAPVQLNDKYKLDYQHALQFLHSYRGSEATFNSYRREVERLLHWSWKVAKKPINKIKRDDFESFIEFCQNPPTHWIGTKNVKRYMDKDGERITNSDWRPFVATKPEQYILSPKALQAVFSVLGSFYSYLIQEDYIDWNPVAQIRQKSKYLRKQSSQPKIRRLSDLQWAYVIETAEQLACEYPDRHERTLFIMNALYGMYLRISELTAQKRWQPQMGDFQKDLDGHWWFTTVGKGNKERQVSVSNAMLDALKRYRLSLGLSPLPTPGEQTPLILRSNGKGPITSTRQIRSIVQFCFDQAYARMQTDGLGDDATELQSATVHWLRHTGISNDVKHRPREHVRDDAGHGSSAITDKYIDIGMRERHASAQNKPMNPLED